MTVRVCRHCGVRPGTRARGLCYGCFYAPGVRELYPSTSKYARRGLGTGNAAGKPPGGPCPAPAGSAERIATLRRRVEAGESLHHPADNRAYEG